VVAIGVFSLLVILLLGTRLREATPSRALLSRSLIPMADRDKCCDTALLGSSWLL
jgi:hypothetical protein